MLRALCSPEELAKLWPLCFRSHQFLMVNTLNVHFAEERAITVEYGNGHFGWLRAAQWQWAQPL